MTYEERIYELVRKKNKVELTEGAREIVDKAIEIATEIKADLDECEAEHKPYTNIVKYLQTEMEYLLQNNPKPLKKDLQEFVSTVNSVLFVTTGTRVGNKIIDRARIRV